MDDEEKTLELKKSSLDYLLCDYRNAQVPRSTREFFSIALRVLEGEYWSEWVCAVSSSRSVLSSWLVMIAIVIKFESDLPTKDQKKRMCFLWQEESTSVLCQITGISMPLYSVTC